MMHRRRFLTISCAALGSPAFARPARWRGTALGAEVSIEIHGPEDQTGPAIAAARTALRDVERRFSLYLPSSDISRLNATGVLNDPHPDVLALMTEVSRLYSATEGLFDPTVQTLWTPYVQNRPVDDLRGHLGWNKVNISPKRITLGPRQQVTFNGIAQGFATDRVTEILRAAGFIDLFVDIGEQAALGPSRRLGVVDPLQGLLGTLTLKDAAVATSSPSATPVGSHGHILSPSGQPPRWSTVSVIAPRATLADGLSTALCLADRDDIRRIQKAVDADRILVADGQGDVTTFT